MRKSATRTGVPKIGAETVRERPFGEEAYKALGELAAGPPFSGNVGYAVKVAVNYFGGPDRTRDLTADEVRKAFDAIANKVETDAAGGTNGGASGSNGGRTYHRVPLEEGTQAKWNAQSVPAWLGLRFREIAERFAEKIKAGEKITDDDLDLLAAEKAAEKVRIEELVALRPDPLASGPVDCVSNLHMEADGPRTFEPRTRYKLVRDASRKLVRAVHKSLREGTPPEEAWIRQGNFGIFRDADGKLTGAPHCDICRDRVLNTVSEARDALPGIQAKFGAALKAAGLTMAQAMEESAELSPELAKAKVEFIETRALVEEKIVFYDTQGMQRVIAASKRTAERPRTVVSQFGLNLPQGGGPRQSKAERATGWRNQPRRRGNQ